MPIYEFRCKENNHSYEVWRSISGRDINTNCPDCGSDGQRIYSPPMTLTSGILRLDKKERGPQLVTRSSTRSEKKAPRLKESGSRPWMLTRGC